ncbi:hypothetical protein [Paenibacillus sp. YYML68]|uniref:hypothetical protein n=1 Tax=Paenibacillus sp. YYML68 TaxID=2909250 RepID=UPI0024937D39|nr:hypothetical protein [Paenibacillus sp. YYML68]
MSKKLHNNGLWESSRMMLPEHREALIERRKSKQDEAGVEGAPVARPNVPTQEELAWIRSSALLPIMLSIVENNLQTIQTSSYPLKRLYVSATHLLMDAIHADLAKVRKSLKQRGIKVFEDEKIDGAIRYRFICRGYEDSFVMLRDMVRAEISVRLSDYIGGIFQRLGAAEAVKTAGKPGE